MTVPGDDDVIMKALRAAAADEARADQVAHAEMLRLAPGLAAPPDQAARAEIADRLLGGGAAAPLQRRAAPPGRRFSLRQLWIPLGLAVPLAAGFMFLARPRPIAPLPAYQAELSGYVREVRGGEAPAEGPRRLGPGSVLRVNLRPDVATDGGGELVAAAFFQAATANAPSPWRPVSVSFQAAPSGAVAVSAPYPEAFAGAQGAGELRVLVLRPALASRAAALASSADSAGAGWQRVSVSVVLGAGH
jgi:hypothetical protein